ncbi:MAG: hypothetical protein ACD_76C00085G0003 [uncultured bacterium]|nr:MAG: hypothetical protein ACD_76C00085G0003 [uncultured bacterium]
MKPSKSLKVKEKSSGMRIDVFLSQELKISRAQVQKYIKSGFIFVDGELAKSSSRTSKGQKIEITIKPENNSDKKLPELNIIYEDDDVLVLNKQSGVVVHGASGVHEPTLADSVVAKYPKIARVGENKMRPGVVHRLDRGASGVIVFAKNKKAFLHLKDQFQSRTAKKIYIVLVHGQMPKNFGTLRVNIARSERTGKMVSRPMSQEGKEAITNYSVTKNYRNYSLLEVHIETGRTHQIRTTMQASGHPIAGDTLYMNRKLKQAEINRPFLHASFLTITLPSGEVKTFSAELPVELKKYLETLT